MSDIAASSRIDDARSKISNVSKIRPDIIDEDLPKKIDVQLEKFENRDEKFEIVLYELLKISAMLGNGWSDETHNLVKQADCPHCKKPIAVRFVRTSKDPNTSKGNYNIEKLWIERGKNTHTLVRFGDLVCLILILKKGKEEDHTPIQNEVFSFV